MTTIIPSKQIARLRSLMLTALLSAGFAAAFIAADRHSATKLQQAGAGSSGAGIDAGTSASGVSGTLDWQSLDLERFSAPASSGAMRASSEALNRKLDQSTVWN